jgi:alkanesulfonate monooxygenase SsuD/methylene tetrahydromethanopterin reductase-like flavin-dependent oxidoreductase (luciferase family)
MRRKAFVGTGPQVADKLRALADELSLDELVINTWAHDPAVRRKSYALLADEFRLAQTR